MAVISGLGLSVRVCLHLIPCSGLCRRLLPGPTGGGLHNLIGCAGLRKDRQVGVHLVQEATLDVCPRCASAALSADVCADGSRERMRGVFEVTSDTNRLGVPAKSRLSRDTTRTMESSNDS